MDAPISRLRRPALLLTRCTIVTVWASLFSVATPAAVGTVIYVPGDYPTIQQALDAAVDGDEIIVAPGTYSEAVDLLGKAVYLHSSDGYEVTTIDATGLDASVVTCVNGSGETRIIQGFTITGGRGVPILSDTYGGGLFAQSTSLALRDCLFTDNRVKAYGGAAYSERSTLEVEDCLFIDNDASVPTHGWVDHSGGALASNGGSLSLLRCTFRRNTAHQTYGSSLSFATGGAVDSRDTLLTIADCLFDSNTCDTFGGAVATRGDAPVLIEYCTFTGNESQGYNTTYDQAGSGGAIGNGSPLTLQYCHFEANTASRYGYSDVPTGGAIRDYEDVIPAVITQCTFVDNNCTGNGGAMAMTECSTEVSLCTFEANSASRGGAFYVENADPIIRDCTILANTAMSGGGAVLAEGARPVLLRCNMTGNYGDLRGGAIECQASTLMIIEDCTVAENVCDRSGGAMYSTNSTLRAFRCVFTANAGMEGGAFYARAEAELDAINCILDCNTSIQSGAAVFTTAATVTLYNCLTRYNVAGADGNTASGDGAFQAFNSILWDDPVQVSVDASEVRYCNVRGSFEGEGNIEADPLFLDAHERNYRMTSGSPCIDACSNALVPVITRTDADGLTRFVDDIGKPDLGSGPGYVVDIGPYEYQGTSVAALTVIPTPVQALLPLDCVVTRAQARTLTWLLYSTSGSGSTYIESLNVTVDMRSPQYFAGPLLTSDAGDVRFRLQMPGVLSDRKILLQAVQHDMATNYVGTRILGL